MNEDESVYTNTDVLKVIRETIKRNELKGEDGAFFVVDLDDIESKYNHWKTFLPDIEPFYAVKCNDDKNILKYMVSIGLSFDCASKNEIESVLSLGGSADKIVYSQPHKALSHLTYARDSGVDLQVFDCEEELEKLNKIFPSARLLLRILPSFDKAVVTLGQKYGCVFEEARTLLRKAKQNGQNVVGISFHVGWTCQDGEAYTVALKQSSDLFKLGKSIGFDMNIVDIGGGFTGEMFKAIVLGIQSGRRYDFPENCRFIAEPGTYLVQTAATLVTQVIGKKYEKGSVGQPLISYVLNEGRRGSFTMYNQSIVQYGPIGPYPVERKKDKTMLKSVLWGPTCDSRDRLAGEYLLPEMEISDWLYFTRAGAYTKTFQTDFNGMPRSNCVCFSRTDTT